MTLPLPVLDVVGVEVDDSEGGGEVVSDLDALGVRELVLVTERECEMERVGESEREKLMGAETEAEGVRVRD